MYAMYYLYLHHLKTLLTLHWTFAFILQTLKNGLISNIKLVPLEDILI